MLVEDTVPVQMIASALSPIKELRTDAIILTATVPSVVLEENVFATRSPELRTSFFNDSNRISFC